MRVFGLDFETTGLDPKKDRITEVGGVLWSCPKKRVIVAYSGFCHDDTYGEFAPETLAMMDRISGIELADLLEFGAPLKRHLEWLEEFCAKHKVEAIVAHNGLNFDRPFLYAELDRAGLEAPCLRSLHWIDTRTDLPFDARPDSLKLKHLAGDHGFINPFPHRALFDVMTMMKVFSQYDAEKIMANSKTGMAILRAVVPHPKNDGGKGKDAAKALGYSWQSVNYKEYPNFWVKCVRETDVDREKEAASKCPVPFSVGVLERIARC